MRTFAVLLVCGIVAAGGYFGYRHIQQPAEARFDIQTVEAKRGSVRRVVSTTGKVRALVQVEVGSQISGQIDQLPIDFNATVKEGDLLARIDPRTYRGRVAEAQAAVEVAKAGIAMQEAALARSQSNLRQAQREFDRARELRQAGSGTVVAQDNAQAALEASRADLEVARAQIANAKATLAQREAALATARIDLERTEIRSPISGIVIERAVELGQTVAASLSAPKLFLIAEDLSRIQIEAEVDEADIGQVAIGNPVSFTVDAYPELTFEGAVEQIRLAPTEAQNVVTYTVVISANNPAGRLLPGMTTNVAIVTGERADVLVVANEALRFQPRGAAEALATEKPQPLGSASASQGPQRGPGGPAAQLDRLKGELGLTDEQVERAREIFRREFSALREGGGGPPTADQREQVRSRITQAMREVLTPDQFAKYQEIQKRIGTGPRRGTVWLLEADGRLTRREVRLGLTDDSVTEIVYGLEAGTKVVTRVRERLS